MILLRSIIGFVVQMRKWSDPAPQSFMSVWIERMVFQMRIQEPNRTGMINAYSKTGQTPVGKERKVSMGKDEVNISAEALEMLKQVEDPDSPARQEKIQRLKKQVEEGTYRVPSDKIADKILSFWRKL
jgi:negative regulator of flagellin synthesis FlgM